MIIDNSEFPSKFIAEGNKSNVKEVYYKEIFDKIVKR